MEFGGNGSFGALRLLRTTEIELAFDLYLLFCAEGDSPESKNPYLFCIIIFSVYTTVGRL